MKSIMKRSEIQLLTSLIGKKFLHLVSANLTPDLVGDSVYVLTEFDSIKIGSRVVVLNFEGIDEEYTVLTVSSLESDVLSGNRNSQDRFYKFSNEEIIQGYVFRETITEYENDVENWTYESDVAVVFQLKSGFISVSKDTHNNGVLQVEYLYDLETLTNVPNLYSDNLFVTHTISRSKVSFSDSLEELN